MTFSTQATGVQGSRLKSQELTVYKLWTFDQAPSGILTGNGQQAIVQDRTRKSWLARSLCPENLWVATPDLSKGGCFGRGLNPLTLLACSLFPVAFSFKLLTLD